MPIEITLPALSPTMQQGKVLVWKKKVGDWVESGDVLCEIETDKAVMEVESLESGLLHQIFVPADSDPVPVQAVLALLLEEGEEPPSLAQKTPAIVPAQKTPPLPSLPSDAEALPPLTSGDDPKIGLNEKHTRLFATPLAKNKAKKEKLDLKNVTGSGPYGRIVLADVDRALAQPSPAIQTPQPSSKAPEPSFAPPATPPSSTKRIPLSMMRKVIAQRLTESKQTIPHFYLTSDISMDAVLALRTQINLIQEEKISVNDFVIKAVALALQAIPECNVRFEQDYIEQYTTSDISVAVSLENGLITPIIYGAEQKTLVQISAEVKRLAQLARAGKLAPSDYQGGNFTISNLGMYGIKAFSAIINPPQAAILAVGAAEPRPCVREGNLVVATQMTCTLSADHRAIDGAKGAEFLAKLRHLLENPLTLLVAS